MISFGVRRSTCFRLSQEELSAMTDAIASALREIALTPQMVGPIDCSVVEAYEASAIAARYAESSTGL